MQEWFVVFIHSWIKGQINHWVKIKGLENKTIPIIILHGGPGGNNYVFERTIGPLLEEFATIVYYEQRGCGRSYAAKDTNDYMMLTLINDLDELIETLGVEKVSLLGYSFGAELALRFTKQHPEKVNKLIDIDGRNEAAIYLHAVGSL